MMGIFSSIVDFVKSLVTQLVVTVSNIFGGGQTGVLIATLAVIVVAFVLMSPAALQAIIANPLTLLTSHVMLTSFIVSAVVQFVTVLLPTVGRDLGYVVGLASFAMLGFNLAAMYTSSVWTSEQAFAYLFPASLGLTSVQIEGYYSLVSDSVTATTVAAILAGPSSPLFQGVEAGFFAVPTLVAGIADTIVSSAASSLLWIVGVIALGYLAASGTSKRGERGPVNGY